MGSGMWKFSDVGISVCVITTFFLHVCCCFARTARYPFVKEATSAPATVEYDFIVVGGGPAGCAVAATLSAAAKVLLLERGGWPYDNGNITNREGLPFVMMMDSSPTSPVQSFISTDGVYNSRARVLGGGSSINGGFFSRASERYVRRAGWDRRLVEESYAWAERKLVFKPQPVHAWQEAVRAGLRGAGVLPDNGFTTKHLSGTKIGGTIFDKNGHRHTAVDLLDYADATNINVYLHAVVEKVLIHKSFKGKQPKAYGVIFKDSVGNCHVASLKNGLTNAVILSAGAVGSPQLLMLSGIGPAKNLKDHKIDLILEQPLVGQGMSDNPRTSIPVPFRKPVDISLIETVGISRVGSFVEALSGFLEPVPVATGVVLDDPEFLKQTLPWFGFPTNLTGLQSLYMQMGTIMQKGIGPISKGYLELQNSDPNDNPRITFNYFKDPKDLKRCVDGMKIMKKIVETKAVSFFRYPSATFESIINFTLTVPTNMRKKHISSTYSLKQFCIDTVVTIWHYHGGCLVDKVIDREYKIIGVDSLRVVDGSTFFDAPGTNPQATVMMLGRYVGQKILQERRRNNP